MKVLYTFLIFLFSVSAKAQNTLPFKELQNLSQMVDSLSYPESPQFDQDYSFKYDPDSGWVGLSMEKFIKGTTTKTPDQYLSFFRLSDIDPATISTKDEAGYGSLIFFTANNKPLIYKYVYVNGELRMPGQGDREFMGYWKKQSDKILLERIKFELTRLINLTWDGNPPQYHTDIEFNSPMIINGEEIVFDGDVEEREVFIIADQMPLFGDSKSVKESDVEIETYFKAKLKADDIQSSGTVYASFYIEKDGSVSNTKLLKGCGNELDDLVLKYLRSMPKWKSGMKDGESAAVVKNVGMTN